MGGFADFDFVHHEPWFEPFGTVPCRDGAYGLGVDFQHADAVPVNRDTDLDHTGIAGIFRGCLDRH